MKVAGTRKTVLSAGLAATRLALFLVAALLLPESRAWSHVARIDSTADTVEYINVNAGRSVDTLDLPGGQFADYGYDSVGRMVESIPKNSGGSDNPGYHNNLVANTISQSGTWASGNLYRLSSKRLDYAGPEGIYYYGYRFYDPDLRRWINRDPLGEAADINLYRFNYNNPINFVDPDGLWGVQIGVVNLGYGDPKYVFDDFGEFVDDFTIGGAAVTDRLFPFYDPYTGFYDPCDESIQNAQALGGIGGQIGLFATGAGFYRAFGQAVGRAGGASLSQASNNSLLQGWFGRRLFNTSLKAGLTELSPSLGNALVNAKNIGEGVLAVDGIINTKNNFNELID